VLELAEAWQARPRFPAELRSFEGANGSTQPARSFTALHIRTLDPSVEFQGRGTNLRTETLNKGQVSSDKTLKPGARAFLRNLDALVEHSDFCTFDQRPSNAEQRAEPRTEVFLSTDSLALKERLLRKFAQYDGGSGGASGGFSVGYFECHADRLQVRRGRALTDTQVRQPVPSGTPLRHHEL